ncbi:MAG: hypothetical protein ACLFVI_08140 [Archaeoglobaceae archaeon]
MLEMGLFELTFIVFTYTVVVLLIHRDASNRYPAKSIKPSLWAVAVVVMHIAGLAIYIFLRPGYTKR